MAISNLSAKKPWSITATDDTTYRFELRAGDHWADDYSSSIQRSMLSTFGTKWPERTPIDVSYKLTVEPGQKNTASWLLVGQFHQQTNDGKSPPFAVELHGEHMRIVARSPSTTYVLYEDPDPIQRGHAYDMQLKLNFDKSGDGSVQVWRDGNKIVDYHGPVGYGDGVYWVEGVYRPNAPETMAVQFADLKISTPSSSLNLTAEGATTNPGSGSGEAPPPPQSPSTPPADNPSKKPHQHDSNYHESKYHKAIEKYYNKVAKWEAADKKHGFVQNDPSKGMQKFAQKFAEKNTSSWSQADSFKSADSAHISKLLKHADGAAADHGSHGISIGDQLIALLHTTHHE